jgi:hypothetical protein
MLDGARRTTFFIQLIRRHLHLEHAKRRRRTLTFRALHTVQPSRDLPFDLRVLTASL